MLFEVGSILMGAAGREFHHRLHTGRTLHWSERLAVSWLMLCRSILSETVAFPGTHMMASRRREGAKSEWWYRPIPRTCGS